MPDTLPIAAETSPGNPKAAVIGWPEATSYALLLTAIGIFVTRYSFNWGRTDDFLLIEWYQRAFVQHTMSLRQFVTLADNSHLLAAEAFASWALFAVFGVNFKVLVYFSASLLLAGSGLLTLLIWPDRRHRAARCLALLLPLVLMFHPVQIHQLFWAFEIGWFMVNFGLVANVFLLERYGQRGLPLLALVCLVASFSSAHGNFLWLAAALHLALRPDLRHRLAWWALLGAGFVAGAVAISLFTYPEAGGVRRGALHLVDAWHVAVYFVSLLGSVFGTRAPAALWLLGSATLALVAAACWTIRRQPAMRPGERAGLVLMAGSAMFVAAFALARFRYGVPWALLEYHAGPLPVPLFCGLGLIGIEALDRAAADGSDRGARASLWVGRVCCGFALASVAAFLPLALLYGRECLVRRVLAMHVSCAGGVSELVLLRLNGFYVTMPLLDRTLPAARALCVTSEPKWIRAYEHEPALFTAMAASHPQDAPMLRDVWDLYRTHIDMTRLWPVDQPQTALRLLRFAHDDAVRHGRFDPELLGADQDRLASLDVPP